MAKKKMKNYSKKKQKNRKQRQGRRLTSADSAINEIEQKLNECYTSGNQSLAGAVPDYTKFRMWLAGKLVAEDQRPIRPTYNPFGEASVAQYYHGLLSLLLKYEAEVEKHAEKVSVKTRNKYKLLISAYDNMSNRAKEFFGAIKDESMREGELDDGLNDLNAAQLRIRFFEAMEQKKEHVAFKILGKMKESDHDEGEIDYFEALSYFRANHFEEAIRYAKRLKKGQVDYPSAQAMIFESYALLGDVQRLKEHWENFTGNGEKIATYFFIYLIQVAIMNCKDYDSDIKVIMGIMTPQSKKYLSDEISYLPEFNRYSCQLAIEFIERSHEKDLQMLAFEQHATDIQDDVTIEDLMEDRDEKLGAALVLHDQLFDALINADDPSAIILRYLLNVNYEKNEDDFITAFMAQYRLNKKERFVDNILSNRKQLMQFKDERIWELFELAFVEAIALNHPKTTVIEKILETQQDFATNKRKFEEQATVTKWLASLSPMGKLSFEATEMLYQRSKQEAVSWKDAGMISLGFFRILEVELNERFIKPISKSISFDKLEEKLHKLKENQSNPSDTIKFWESILKNFKLIQLGKKSGMELGPLNHFFGKIKKVNGFDSELKQLFFEELKKHLSANGLKALHTGKLAAIVNSEIRNQFRNPPAHTKFVPLHVAEQCRTYVQDVLKQLDQWYAGE